MPETHLEVASTPSLDRIPAEEWDLLAGNDPLWRHGWLSALEGTATEPRSYFVLRAGGQLVAAAVCTRSTAAHGGWDRRIFGRGAFLARLVGAGVSPMLTAGSRFGITSPIRTRPSADTEEARRWGMALLDALIATAERERRTLGLEGVTAGSWLEPLLAAQGFQRVSDAPSTTLEVTWPDFPGYLEFVGRQYKSMPGTIRHERNRARRAGVTIQRLTHPGAHATALHQLLEAHSQRLNGVSTRFTPETLIHLADRLGERLVLNVAWRGGQPIGVVVGLLDGGTLFVLQVGVDHAHQRETLVYFVLTYDASIELALRHGVRRIIAGKLVYGVKRRRGFGLVPLNLHLRPRRWRTRLFLAAAERLSVLRLRGVMGGGAT